MLLRTYLLIIFSVVIIQSKGQLACGQDIDLNTWIQEGSITDGTWTVSPDGNSVEQSINGEPTFFVSPDTFINVIMEGKIKVNTANDDDLVGFVFGYNDPSGVIAPNAMNVQSYVFDWKQSEQTDGGGRSQEGYALYDVNGIVDYTDYQGSTGPVFWARENTPVSKLLATNYGNNGWNDFQEYTFKLKYTAWNVTIWIDGVEVINFDDCYRPGRFGFYNSSQNFVIYSDFSYQYIADFDVVNPDICVNDTGKFEIGFNSCPYSGFYPKGTTFDWDFDDGEIGEGRSEKHKYTASGNYDVVLTVTDPLGCADTSVHPIKVSWLDIDLADTTILCDGKEVLLNASTDGAILYEWNTGIKDSIITIKSAGNYIIKIEDSVGCMGADTVEVISQDFPKLTLPNDTNLCVGDSIEIAVNLTDVEFNWSTGDSSNSVWITNEGAVWLEVATTGGCKSKDGMFVFYSSPDVKLPNDTSICEPDSTLKVTSLASDYKSILWSTGGTNSIEVVNSSQLLTIIASDENGCVANDSMLVVFEKIPIFKLPNDTGLCVGDSLNIAVNLNDVNFKWSSGSVDDNVFIFKSGTYWVNVESSAGCIASDSIEVLYSGPKVSLPNDTSLCVSDHLFEVPSIASDYKFVLWNTGETTSEVYIDSTQLLIVTVSDDYGCEAIDSIQVSFEELPIVKLPNDTVLCSGDQLMISVDDALSDLSILWSGVTIKDPTSHSVSIQEDGIYVLKATSDLGWTCNKK